MDSPAPLIPLSRALQIIAAQLSLGTFDPPLLACTVSALVPLYAVDGEKQQPLRESDLHGAIFAASGGAITFRDGRRAIDNLAVTSDAIVRVIHVLQGATLQLESSNG